MTDPPGLQSAVIRRELWMAVPWLEGGVPTCLVAYTLASTYGTAQLLSATETCAGLVLGEGTASIFTAAGTAVAHAVLH